MRILITGFSGFVSPHFLALLDKVEPGSTVLGIDKQIPDFTFSDYTNLTISFEVIDLLNRQSTDTILETFKPEYILHLAAVSSVAHSWQAPLDCFVNNTTIFLNLAEHLRITKNKCRILSVGSSEEFGDINPNELPLTEEHPLKPVSPYAVARVSQEMLSKVYADGFLLDIVMTRSFNHIGPGQRENFVISSFAKQLTRLWKTKYADNKIVTGDISIIRDFVDVRDIVRAYHLLLKKGRSGEVYNICSGNGIILKDVISTMSRLLGINVEVTVNSELIRPNENKAIIGSYQKINAELNWKPEISIEQSLSDIIRYWQTKVD